MWLILATLSAALLGLYDAMKKHSLRGNAVMPVLCLNTLFCSMLFVPSLLLSATGVLDSGNAFYIPQWCWSEQRYILIKSFIVLSSWVLGYYAIKHLPLTIVGPINATRPVLVIIGALIIYGEHLNLWQWGGVLLTIFSLFLMNATGRKEGIRFTHNKWIWCLAGAAIIGASSGLYDKFLMSPVDAGGLALHKMAVQAWSNIYQLVIMCVLLATLWLPTRHKTTPFKWRYSIILISLFLTAADLAYFYALTFPDAMISVVSMIRRGSVIVSFLCGALFFRDKNLKAKAFDLLLVLLGLVLLWIGTA
jgi:drug/metabolite transporter (DMT)-like permease